MAILTAHFDSTAFLAQVSKAIDLFEAKYPYHCALFAFDNAPSHQKWTPDALSAWKMPKFPSHNWPSPRVCMRDARFEDGSPQSLYYPNHQFKGMKAILQERGFWPAPDPITNQELPAECKGFKCANGRTNCCAHCLLFNQPDFASQKSMVEELVESRGHLVIFYPKYHCKLNFIEMVWGHAKYNYRMYTTPSSEAEMVSNIHESWCLELSWFIKDATVFIFLVKFQAIWKGISRYANHAARFMHTYLKGLTGSQAAWANKSYHGHWTLPPDLIELSKQI
jgi:hypothetical protein